MNPDDPKIVHLNTKPQVSPTFTFPLKPLYWAVVLDVFLTVFLIFHFIQIWDLYTEILNKLLEIAK